MKAMLRRTIAAAVLAAACTGCSVQTIGAPKGDHTLYAVFDDVQNLVAGHSVQLSDVRIGSVVGVRLQGYRVRVALSIADGRRVPAGTTAAIAKTSLLGENYVRLTAPKGASLSAGPFLAQNATITRTSLRPDLESVTEKIGPILAAAGGQDINAIVTSLATASGGGRSRLNQIIKQATELSGSYAAAADDLVRVVDGMARLGRSLERGSSDLERLPDTVSQATERVRKDRSELKSAVRELTRLGTSFNKTVQERHAPRLRALLQRLDQILTAMTRGKDQLKALTTALDKNFINHPSLSYDGQGIAHVWLLGMLPGPGEQRPARSDPIRDLTRLLAPGPR
ncbi:MCE family protein [Actinomadura sp. 9N407]|uniref:MCE family protein n=1 Tax=Actinomadura sp. 9N407 TaxID=3375154 RepID=UPI003792E194